jgi:hypothetical protein
MSRRFALLLAIGASQVSFPAFAQDDEASAEETGRQVRYKERTEIDFEEVDVNGELVKPQGSLLLDRKRASFNPLIRIRQDFNAEMKESVDEVK